ncbi:DEKNAAC103195 [Brettanomyces naardenensis]|uniref:Beta-mannosidase B n=1 Tax=Brettanomyces naardenensis TaxID=13370 RepID=A0A448YMK1_BRENA|nr:DEKNAAC103195 [Brettanomyces naardenensis]
MSSFFSKMTYQELNTTLALSGWQYRRADTTEWKAAREGAVTTQIQADLLNNGEIPDPFVDTNARDVQWVGEKDWEYRTSFSVPRSAASKSHQVLEFDGLDTFASVRLNGKLILETDNMFVKYTVDVTDQLVYDGPNELVIYFKSALLEARRLEKIHGKSYCFNGETSRVQVRKAQYGWGWDWGDSIMTCGPWRPVRLVSYDGRMTDVYVKTEVRGTREAKIDVQVTIDGEADSVGVTVIDPEGNTVDSKDTTGTSVSFTLSNPALWYPKGTGKQPLYTFITTLYSKNRPLQVDTKKVGLRHVELVQEPVQGEKGTSFFFRVNGVPVYSSGSNWIPGHSIPCLFTDDDYRKWLQLAVDGNQNMIRVWGGGYYEEEIFYAECDRLGLMVWQDFMFACGAYPGSPEFIASVSREVETQLRRLRNHCCLTVFAGNNEDYQVAQEFGLDWDPDDHSGDYSKTNFPARTIYENTLPALVKKLQPDVPYDPGSPWGGENTADSTVGDIHQWNVWHGTQEKYQDWYKLGGRFVSEFGMEALPSMKSYREFITDPSELYPQSETVDFHNKAGGFERRLALYVIENVKVGAMDMENWIYSTQLMQAECLSYAYKCWRRRWSGDGKRYSGGAIVWQLNDCCPVASWAIVDFYGRPKLSFYAVKRESAAIGLGMYRDELIPKIEGTNAVFLNDGPHDYHDHTYNVDIWGVNSSLKDQPATLLVDIYDVESGKKLKSLDPEKVVLKSNQTTEFVKELSVPRLSVVYSRVLVDGKPIATAADWPQPLKYLKFPKRKVNFEVFDGYIKLTSDKPVKGVLLTVKNREVFLQDNGFDIFPSDEIIVKGDVRRDDDVTMRFYEM